MRVASELSDSEQSYIEAIHSLIGDFGYARVADIAARLSVKPPSVTNMLQKLDEGHFVTYTRYRGVVLTPKGKKLAKMLERRHRALRDFLVMIGVSEANADKDACAIEHKMHRESVEKLAKFMEFVRSSPEVPTFLENFEHYRRTESRESC